MARAIVATDIALEVAGRRAIFAAICLMLLSFLLAGCQTVAIAGCDIYPARGITFSATQDTPETVRQIRETNAAFRAACGR